MNSIVGLLCLSLVVHQARADLIDETCNVKYKDLCEKTLRADPASQSADINGLSRIALAATSAHVKAIQARIADLLKTSSDKHALSDCAELYDNAADSIDQCIPAAEARQYDDVNTYVSAAMTDGDTCEDGFKPGPSGLTQDNQNFGHLCSIVLAICNKAASI